MSAAAEAGATAEALVLRVLRGSPTPEELAAATAALLALTRPSAPDDVPDEPSATARRTAAWGRTGPVAHLSAASWRH